MSTANKLTYLNDTKGLLKQKINNLGGDITDNTTFRQYVDKLQTIYDNAPKTDYEEGSNITLSNCLKGKLDFEDDKVGYGDTSQESTQGYNLFNITDYSTSNEFSTNYATNIVKTKNSVSFYCPAKMNGIYVNRAYISNVIDNFNSDTTYYISVDVEVESASKIYFGSGQLEVYNLSPGKQRITKYTKCSNYNGLEGIYFYNFNDGAGSFKISNIMVSISNNDWEPYTNGAAPNPTYPFPVKTVTGEQEVTIRGINKLPPATATSNVVNSMTFSTNGKGTYTLNGTASATSYYDYSIEEYTIKEGDYLYLKNTETNSNISVALLYNDTQIMYTGPSSANRIVSLSSYAGSKINTIRTRSTAQTLSDFTLKPMIADISTITDFIEYYKLTKTLNLGNIELAEIGTYRDNIWTDRSTGKWYKHSAIDKFLINSNLQITFSTSTVGFDLVRIDNVTAPNVERPIMSSAFIGIIPEYGSGSVITNRSVNNIYINYLISKIDICAVKNAFSSANDFLTQLDGTPIYYAKTTATDTEITDTMFIEQAEEIYNIMSLNGTAIIEINGTLPMIMKVRALKGE